MMYQAKQAYNIQHMHRQKKKQAQHVIKSLLHNLLCQTSAMGQHYANHTDLTDCSSDAGVDPPQKIFHPDDVRSIMIVVLTGV